MVVTYVVIYTSEPRFFYRDDVQHQHIGVFTALHRTGLSWSSIANFRQSWTLSLIGAETQFGVFNPVSRVRDFIAVLTDNMALNAMLISCFYSLIAVAGAYTAFRALRVRPFYSTTFALCATLNVHILYWDAGSWMPALIGFSWFTWFVAALWWTRRDTRQAFTVAIAGALLVTAGWPTAIISGVVVCLATMVHVAVGRTWNRRQWTYFVGAIVSAVLLSAPTWYVAARWSSATQRHPRGFVNDTFLTHGVDSLLMSWNPFSQPYMNSFAGHAFVFEPLTYIGWFLPLGLWALFHYRDRLGRARADIVATITLLVLTTGPSILGPTRWSFRYQPFAALMVLAIIAEPLQKIIDSRTPLSAFGRMWWWVGGTLVLLQVAQRPQVSVIVPTIVVASVLLVAPRVIGAWKPSIVVAVLVMSAPLTAMYLVAVDGQPVTPNDRGVTTSRTELQKEFSALADRRVVVLANEVSGLTGVSMRQGRAFTEPVGEGAITSAVIPDGNILLAADLNIELINGYSAMPNRLVVDALHLRKFGWATAETVNALSAPSDDTGRPLIDVMGINGVVVQNSEEFSGMDVLLADGWTIASRTDAYTMYTRDIGQTRNSDWPLHHNNDSLPQQSVLALAVLFGALLVVVIAYLTIFRPRVADA